MKHVSNLLNFCTGGDIRETICARVLRHADNGSKKAKRIAFLIDTAFLIILHEINHVRGYDEQDT